MTPPSPCGRSYAIALPTSLLLLGAWLRLSGLARDARFHPDEALYADLGRRIGLWGDWPLTGFPVDKPPLFFFFSGLAQALFGPTEFAARLPNALASIIMLAIFFALARHLTATPLQAAIPTVLLLLSPMDIAFAISGFIETLMLCFLLLSLWLVLRGQAWPSGLAFGLAIAVKPAALFWLPVLALSMLVQPSWKIRALWRWLIPLIGVIILISAWDRAGSLGSFWTLGEQNLATGRFIRADEVTARAGGWLHWLGYMWPGAWVGGLAGVGIGAYLWQARGLASRAALWGWGVFGFGWAYLLLHWWVAFNVFDRYVLPVLPFIMLLAGLGLGTFRRNAWRVGIIFLLFAFGWPVAWEAAQGRAPLATDAGQHQGIDQLAEVMNAQYAGEVFYDHWLGWELGYYLGPEPRAFVLYFETPDDMVAYAQNELQAHGAMRYLVGPRADARFWAGQARAAGLNVQIVYRDT
ncbi:MAG: glycosyltransferase family 39 protein, partial [Anaerolineales bacterium]